MRRESDIRAGTSWPHPGRITNMATRDVDEPGIAPCRPDAECVADRPDANPCKPEPETQADRAGQRAVEDRHRARRTAEQDRPAERAMDRRAIARHEIGAIAHQTSAPTPNEKQESKKDEAGQGLDAETAERRVGKQVGK